jgi:NADPH:quinone reductase-like Zn-dependent oxidoreductase
MEPNRAALQPFQKADNLEVKETPFPHASTHQIVIRNRAVAINPIDTLIQSRGNIMYTHLKYPFVLGYDMAGDVIEVGDGVTRFKVGDRVLGFSQAADKNINDPAQGAFQRYVVVSEDLACCIPEHIDFAHAATLPLGLATAAAALFDIAQLGLRLPRQPKQSPTNQTVVIWGGSTSVGCNAIQLAAASGYEVFATASPQNHEYLRKLGASRVWDYKTSSVVDDLVGALQGKTLAGVVSIGVGAAEKCMQIVERCEGNKFVAMVTFPVPQKEPQNFVFLRTAVVFVSSLIYYKIRGARKGFKSNLVAIGPTLENGVARHIWTEFLPRALEARSFVPAPEPEVVGHGLELIQEAFERLREGVSAKKLVVTL